MNLITALALAGIAIAPGTKPDIDPFAQIDTRVGADGMGDDPFNFSDTAGDALGRYADELGNVAKKAAAAGLTKQHIRKILGIPTQDPSQPRDQILPVDSGATPLIGAGAVTDVQAKPQKPFRADRLVIGASVAPNFLINNFTIGTETQFVANQGSIPADIFSPTAVGTRLLGTIADPGIVLDLNVTNTSGGGLRFNGAFIGPAKTSGTTFA